MQKMILIILFFFTQNTLTHATVIFDPHPIRVSAGTKSWANAIKLKAQNKLIHSQDRDGYTECKRAAEINNVVLCGTYLQRDMNAMLLRATVFAEGMANYPKGSMLTTNDKLLSTHADIIGGHDIKSNDLANFYEAVTKKCKHNKNYCLNSNEQTFYKNVYFPLQKKDENFVLISFSVQSALTSNQIVSHEFLHAIYFLDPKYKTKISKFWQVKLNRNERNKIKKQLKALGYNDQDDNLMQNEFQAYMLMDGADDARLASLVPKYEPRIFKYLTQNKRA